MVYYSKTQLRNHLRIQLENSQLYRQGHRVSVMGSNLPEFVKHVSSRTWIRFPFPGPVLSVAPCCHFYLAAISHVCFSQLNVNQVVNFIKKKKETRNLRIIIQAGHKDSKYQSIGKFCVLQYFILNNFKPRDRLEEQYKKHLHTLHLDLLIVNILSKFAFSFLFTYIHLLNFLKINCRCLNTSHLNAF